MMTKHWRALAGLMPLLALAAPLASVQTAGAAPRVTISPDTFLDVANPVCGDVSHVPGTCSLRGAVIKANQTARVDIVLDTGIYHLSIAQVAQSNDDASNGDLEVATSMSIRGAGATLTKIVADQGFDDRLIEADHATFEGPFPITVAISDLTVSGGNATGSVSQEPQGGGILNDGENMTLHNVIVDGNRSTATAAGGGIASNGVLSITNSTISNNTADGNGGGLFNLTPGAGTDTFSNLRFVHNIANGSAQQADAGGGAIYNEVDSTTGVARFTDITAVDNAAAGMSGGGVYEDSNPLAVITYDRVTLLANRAVYEGGGFYDGTATPVITNSTISGNTVDEPVILAPASQPRRANPNIDGAGVAIGAPTGKVTLNSSTVTANRAFVGTGGGVYLGRGEKVVLHDTLVTGNKGASGTVSNCNNALGTLTSNGFNIVDDMTCALGATDRQGSSFDPHLGTIGDNGGAADGAPGATNPTQTHALPSGSIAIDSADPAGCPAADQRGIARPQGSRCDVGAYEVLAAVVTPSPTPVLPKAGAGSAWDGRWLAAVVALVVAGGAITALRRAARG